MSIFTLFFVLASTGSDDSGRGAVGRAVFDWTGSRRRADVANWLVDVPLRILMIWLIAWVLARIARRFIRRFSERLMGSAGSGHLRKARDRAPDILISSQVPNVRTAARAETITGVLRNATAGVIYVFAFVYTLDVLGLDLGPLIVSAGVVGVALGFGTQSLVRDFLAGMFILIEDQYGVGDNVDLGEAAGTVEAVNLRTTRLRDVNGTVWYVPNGEIRRAGNKSQQWARALIDIIVTHDTDVDQALGILKATADAVAARPELADEVLEEAEVWGVEDLTPQGITLRLVIKTRPGAQWTVMRALRQEIGVELARAGVEMAPALPPGAGPTA